MGKHKKKYLLAGLGGLVMGLSLMVVFNSFWVRSSSNESCMSCHAHPESDASYKQSYHYINGSGTKTDCAQSVPYTHLDVYKRQVLKNESACNNCGLCQKMCPYHIDLRTFHNGKINHVDCTLCGECVAACANKALNVGIKENKVGKFRKVVPALLAVALTLFGIWAGGKIELPTIDMKWNTEDVASENLQTTTFDNLRTLKCYGSAMTFKAKMEKVPGVHGVKVFVTRQSADILYNAEATSPEKIREAIYILSLIHI